MEWWIVTLEIVGTVAFSVSGALIGMKKHMDIFGVAILGLTTACGGGILRDIILGILPPTTFIDPKYALVAIGVAVVVFLPRLRKRLLESGRIYDFVLLLMDAVGLGVFTVVGIRTAYSLDPGSGLFLMAFVGTVTGVGGGVLRDIMAGNTPYIFIKHVYASASLAGALLASGLMRLGYPLAAMLGGMSVVIAIRLLSARFRWNLPRA